MLSLLITPLILSSPPGKVPGGKKTEGVDESKGSEYGVFIFGVRLGHF